jgi:sugar phosphate isomerase/epimerase
VTRTVIEAPAWSVWFGARAYSLDDVAFLARAGFDFAEIDWKHPHVVREQIPQLAALRRIHGIAFLAHGPNEGNPHNVDEIESTMGPLVSELMQLASQLEIPLYTQHLWLDPRFMSENGIAHKIDLVRMWVDQAERAGLTLCIENLSEHADHFASVFRQLPALRMTLDVGHGEILSRPNAAFGFIRHHSQRIRHVHLHDNHGGNTERDDLHLPIGQGSIDFRRILDALRTVGYEGGLCFEVRREHAIGCREAIRSVINALGPSGPRTET